MIEISPFIQTLLFYIFGIIGLLGIYIFKEEKILNKEKFKEIYKEIKQIKDSTKELSRKEFDEIKGYVKESIDNVINSREFREDLKKSINDIMLHIDSSRSKGEAAMFNHFEDLLKRSLKEITNKIENK
jgi:uncharacterized coiled-coil DUF342 family protein